MRAPRPGLRLRVGASLMLTAALALGVAALALLSPLERKLRQQEVHTLVASAVQSRSAFRDLDVSDTQSNSPTLRKVVRTVARETGARVALLDANRRVIADTDPDERDAFKDFGPALATDRPIRRIVETGSAGEARVALRVRVGGHDDVLALRKPLNEQRSAVATVRRAFLTAALAALAAALVLSAGFAATVLRRLRRLRDAVVSFDASAPGPPLPPDPSHDEVADLGRAFSDMSRRLARQETVRREFVATASHELRTPLMSLQGQLELLDEDLAASTPDLADARRQLAGARTQSDRLARLAGDLLDLSRLDAHLDMRSEPVELGEVARAVAAEFDARAGAQATPLELGGDEDVWVAADPGAVARVLRILIDNALRFSPSGQPVRLGLAKSDGGAAVTVMDAGPGVTEEERERIFERFARGSGSSQDGAGFGLGLAIGRELAERMGGRLELQRAEPGTTTFCMWLPGAARV